MKQHPRKYCSRNKGVQIGSFSLLCTCLNLLVRSGFSKIKTTLDKVKTIAEYSRRVQEQMVLNRTKLKQDFITRWNSTFEILTRFKKQTNKEPVLSMLGLLQSSDNFNLTPHEWTIFCDIQFKF